MLFHLVYSQTWALIGVCNYHLSCWSLAAMCTNISDTTRKYNEITEFLDYFIFSWQMANTVNKQLTVIMWLFFLQFSVEQVRYLKKKKNKRNRTNGQQTGVSTKYNCGTADVGCSEDASTTLPFESGQMGKGFLIYSECLFLYFALDFFDKFIFLSYYWMCKCACILSHFIYTKAVTAESGIYLIKYYSKLYGGKVSNGRLYI